MAMCVVKKKKKPKQASNRKEIKRFQKMHATRILKNKKCKRIQQYKKLLWKDVILGSYITNFDLE
jgi:hypothetical protein